jgi:queuosine precursor transporter
MKRHYDLLLAAFVTLHLCSTLIGTSKVATFAGIDFGAVALFFPLSYVVSDVITEVYGYRRARRAAWAGVGAIVFASLMSAVVVGLPPAADWHGQELVERTFGQTPRLAVAGLLAFAAGMLANASILSRMKIRTQGRHLWARTIGSTLVGEAIDSLIFFPLAFYGVWETPLLARVLVVNYILKISVEVAVTPVTYALCTYLKKAEGADYFDDASAFTWFSSASSPSTASPERGPSSGIFRSK